MDMHAKIDSEPAATRLDAITSMSKRRIKLKLSHIAAIVSAHAYT